jgi:hypothetical protein
MTPDEVFTRARDAVKQLALHQGNGYLFTYDQIWAYAADVPSAQRPGPQRRLIREGFLRKTGSLRNAQSEARAGSPTNEYAFGVAITGNASSTVKTKLLDCVKDGRTSSLSVLTSMSIGEYLRLVDIAYYERRGGVEGQRAPLRTNTAIRIKRTMISDLENGAVLPPVVVGIIIEENLPSIETFTVQNLEKILDEAPEENISIIDGMQRTDALIRVRERPDVLNRTIRVEFWISQTTNSLIYRMLVLNTGQVPWDLRRQIEIIHKPLIQELKKHTAIELLEKDDQRRRARSGQFHADRIVELYMVFGARKERVDTKERLADEFTKLDFIEATALSNFTLQFFEAIGILVTLDHAFSAYPGVEEEDPSKFFAGKDFFSSQPACVGLIASLSIYIFGRPGAAERTEQQQRENLSQLKLFTESLNTRLSGYNEEQLACFIDFDTLNKAMLNKKSGKVGDFEREFFHKAFQTLIEERFEVESMTPCWRAY